MNVIKIILNSTNKNRIFESHNRDENINITKRNPKIGTRSSNLSSCTRVKYNFELSGNFFADAFLTCKQRIFSKYRFVLLLYFIYFLAPYIRQFISVARDMLCL